MTGIDSRVADICNLQAIAMRTSLAQSSSSYWPGIRVRVEGLQNQACHKGLEGVVLKLANDSLVCVRLDQDNKDLRLKLQNVRLLVASADKRKETYTSIRTLEDEEIASRKESLLMRCKRRVPRMSTLLSHTTVWGSPWRIRTSLLRRVKQLLC